MGIDRESLTCVVKIVNVNRFNLGNSYDRNIVSWSVYMRHKKVLAPGNSVFATDHRFSDVKVC